METKDYAGDAAVLNTALTALQRASGGAASHSTTTATAEALPHKRSTSGEHNYMGHPMRENLDTGRGPAPQAHSALGAQQPQLSFRELFDRRDKQHLGSTFRAVGTS